VKDGVLEILWLSIFRNVDDHIVFVPTLHRPALELGIMLLRLGKAPWDRHYETAAGLQHRIQALERVVDGLLYVLKYVAAADKVGDAHVSGIGRADIESWLLMVIRVGVADLGRIVLSKRVPVTDAKTD
jgi:hypothetical protein